jgi:nitrate/nitrite transporter NarK
MPFVNSAGVWTLIVIGSFLRSGTFPLINVIVFETQGIGSVYGGTAVGLVTTIGMLGAFAAPPLGNSLDSINAGMPLVFWGCLAAAAIPLLLTVKTKTSRERQASITFTSS